MTLWNGWRNGGSVANLKMCCAALNLICISQKLTFSFFDCAFRLTCLQLRDESAMNGKEVGLLESDYRYFGFVVGGFGWSCQHTKYGTITVDYTLRVPWMERTRKVFSAIFETVVFCLMNGRINSRRQKQHKKQTLWVVTTQTNGKESILHGSEVSATCSEWKGIWQNQKVRLTHNIYTYIKFKHGTLLLDRRSPISLHVYRPDTEQPT